jgi:hypothetical protein
MKWKEKEGKDGRRREGGRGHSHSFIFRRNELEMRKSEKKINAPKR